MMYILTPAKYDMQMLVMDNEIYMPVYHIHNLAKYEEKKKCKKMECRGVFDLQKLGLIAYLGLLRLPRSLLTAGVKL